MGGEKFYRVLFPAPLLAATFFMTSAPAMSEDATVELSEQEMNLIVGFYGFRSNQQYGSSLEVFGDNRFRYVIHADLAFFVRTGNWIAVDDDGVKFLELEVDAENCTPVPCNTSDSLGRYLIDGSCLLPVPPQTVLPTLLNPSNYYQDIFKLCR